MNDDDKKTQSLVHIGNNQLVKTNNAISISNKLLDSPIRTLFNKAMFDLLYRDEIYVLDVMQSLYFENLLKKSKSLVLTRKIVYEHSEATLTQIYEWFKKYNWVLEADNFNYYLELLFKTRLRYLHVNPDGFKNYNIVNNTFGLTKEKITNIDDVLFLLSSLKSNESLYEFSAKKFFDFSDRWNYIKELLKDTIDFDEQLEILKVNLKDSFDNSDQLLERLGWPQYERNHGDIVANKEYENLRKLFCKVFSKGANNLSVFQNAEPISMRNNLKLDYLFLLEKDNEYSEKLNNYNLCGYGHGFERSNSIQAIEIFDEILKLKPNHIYSLFFRGIAKHRLFKFVEARKDYADVINIDPNFKLVNTFGKLLSRDSSQFWEDW